MKKSLTPRTLTAIILVIVAVVTAAPPASGLDVYAFVGTVKDALGRPLGGVVVDDGVNDTTTAANGSYRLGESSTGTYELTASRSDIESLTKTTNVVLPVDTTVNFEVLYRIDAVVSPIHLTTAAGAATATLTIRSWAPNPGSAGQAGKSCVHVLDTRSGESGPATFDGTNADGSARWRYSVQAPKESFDGAYQLIATARDCGGEAPLTKAAAADYTIDNRGPIVDTIVPRAGGNTFDFAGSKPQPIVASVRDMTSGIAPASIALTLKNSTSGTTTQYSGANVSFDAAKGLVRSAPANAALVAGSAYTVTVQLADKAGNVTTWTQPEPFRVVGLDLSTSGSTAEILPTKCQLTGKKDVVGNQEVACPALKLNLAATSLRTSGAQQPAVGAIVQSVDLSKARMRAVVAGVPVTGLATVSGALTKLLMLFEVPASSASWATYPVPQMNINLGTIKATVPPGATDPVIYLDPTPTTAEDLLCPDPSAASSCDPDPLNRRGQRLRPLPAAPAHFAECDAAASHRAPAVVVPGRDYTAAVSVDAARMSASTVQLNYAINGVWRPPLTKPVSGAGAQFTIPAAQLPEGTVLDYQFEVNGTFPAGSACSARTTRAVVPSNLNFHVLATANRAYENDSLYEFVEDAFLRAAYQPQFNAPGASVTAPALCAASFASPTPCELFPAVAETGPSQLPSPPSTLESVTIGDTGGTAAAAGTFSAARYGCSQWTMTGARWVNNFWPLQTAAAREAGSGAKAEYPWTYNSSYGDVYQWLQAYQFGGGVARAQGTIWALRGMRFNNPSYPNDILPLNVDIVYGWGAEHHSSAGSGAATFAQFFVPDADAEGRSYGSVHIVRYQNGSTVKFATAPMAGARSGTETLVHEGSNYDDWWGTYRLRDQYVSHNHVAYWGIAAEGYTRARVGALSGGGVAEGIQNAYNTDRTWRVKNATTDVRHNCGY